MEADEPEHCWRGMGPLQIVLVVGAMNPGDPSEEATELAKVMLAEQQKEAVAAEARTAAGAVDVVSLVDNVRETAKEDLTTPVEISPAQGMPAIATLPLEKNKDGKYVWREIAEASVISTDLKGSTSISYSKQNRVGARLYQASTGSCSRIFKGSPPTSSISRETDCSRSLLASFTPSVPCAPLSRSTLLA